MTFVSSLGVKFRAYTLSASGGGYIYGLLTLGTCGGKKSITPPRASVTSKSLVKLPQVSRGAHASINPTRKDEEQDRLHWPGSYWNTDLQIRSQGH